LFSVTSAVAAGVGVLLLIVLSERRARLNRHASFHAKAAADQGPYVEKL
jgi:hypothetical protein